MNNWRPMLAYLWWLLPVIIAAIILALVGKD